MDFDPEPREVQIHRCGYASKCKARGCPKRATLIAKKVDGVGRRVRVVLGFKILENVKRTGVCMRREDLAGRLSPCARLHHCGTSQVHRVSASHRLSESHRKAREESSGEHLDRGRPPSLRIAAKSLNCPSLNCVFAGEKGVGSSTSTSMLQSKRLQPIKVHRRTNISALPTTRAERT